MPGLIVDPVNIRIVKLWPLFSLSSLPCDLSLSFFTSLNVPLSRAHSIQNPQVLVSSRAHESTVPLPHQVGRSVHLRHPPL